MKKEPKSDKLRAAWYWVTGRNSNGKKKEKTRFTKRTTIILYVICWILALMPVLGIWYLFASQPEEELPSVETLENPPELLASIVYADDGKSELGRYWSVNRTTVDYNEISPYVFDALIATEDERYMEHAGIDFRAVLRAVSSAGEAGGASTITQQLAKLLFTFEQRDRERALRAAGKTIPNQSTGIWRRVEEKIQENIIAVRLEERYTKKEIITMYLNQFDFLNNAVGIENAAKVYFNKKPIDLTKSQSAMLVGMCKNPSLYNPYSYQIKNYRPNAAKRNGIAMDAVSDAQMQELRTKDSTRAHLRRDQVLKQWLKNSNAKNDALQNYITQKEYDTLRLSPITTDYQVVDHRQGIAPYFRESLRADLTKLFKQKENGAYVYAKKDGSPYNIYKDGLRIYTTINVDMQEYAEKAMRKHLKGTLQPEFEKNNAKLRNFPFANSIKDDMVKNLMRMGRGQTERYRLLKKKGATDEEILKEFSYPVPMRVFSWEGEIDTVMSPDDSIRYYKGILRSSLMSMEPSTGFVKAWVGGIDFNHFAFDQVKQGKRQVGSTIKPFVYATALSMKTSMPCTKYEEGSSFCVDIYGPSGKVTKAWCPAGKIPANATMAVGLAQSNNPITVAVMSSMGGYSGPSNIAKILEDVSIKLRKEDIVPAMCLGVMDLSVYEMVAAQSMFVNQGIYVEPTTILRIEDRNGNVIYNANPASNEALSPDVAYRTLKMMEAVVNSGTSTSLRGTYHPWGGIKHPMAGKTGTTQSNSDGWFIGLTPDLVTGVWTGGEERAERFRSMLWGQGARMALPIYGYYMQQVYKDKKLKISTEEFDKPIGYDPTQFECENGGGDNPDLGL